MSFSNGLHMRVRPAGHGLADQPAGDDAGAAALEFALILPVLAMMIFGVVDFGRFIQARLVITNLSREGGNLASRDIKSGYDLIAMLQSSASPLDLQNNLGRICISSIEAGKAGTNTDTEPVISAQFVGGSLDASCAIGVAGGRPVGLPDNLYAHLVYDEEKKTSDIADLTVVEVSYKYKPITPLPRFIANMLLKDGDGTIIESKAVF